MAIDHVEGLRSASRRQDLIPMLHENPACHIEDEFLILDDENRFPAAMSLARSRWFGRGHGCRDTRDEDRDPGSGARRRMEFHESTRLTHDAVHGREPETCSLVLWFRAEERLERPVEGFAVHSGSRVADSHADV